ncbi:MAG TPA: xanthine dehydrogenase family protein molybdopterin-binding subunit [Xanthobacteraceae bacterium]|nr:xanthine dehydrogenase family protein molybdopterin-binding subunit [Xanthobacteraceae bacterium]
MDVNTPGKGRREDFRLVSGSGKYTADWNLDGQAHGCFLRSDRAHAEIATIDVSAARAVPGVLAVLTGADVVVAGFKTPPAILFMQGKGGSAFKMPHRHALAHERVRFDGEPVALEVAQTQAAAEDAAERIAIAYRDLAPTVTAEAALAAGAAQLHRDVPGNLAFDYEYGARAPVEAAFANAAHVARVTLCAQRVAGNPMEPKACLAAYDAATGMYDVYLPTQGMADVRSGLAQVTGVARENIRIHARDVGGAFGVRNEVYPEFAALFLATRLVGRPVKWVGTRAETILSDHHGRAARLTGALALDRAGRFLAIRIDWLVNLGAYASNAGPFINTGAAPTSSAINAYRIPAAYGSHQLVFTNTTPTTAYRGAGRPNVAYLAERLVDEAARVSGIDRIALRRKNLIAKTAFPYKTPTGSTYDSGDPPGLLEQALAAADWKGFERRRRAARRDGKLRGIGCAVFIEPSGGVGQEEIAIRFGADGSLDLFTLSGASGQGHETVFPQLVADILGVASATVRLRASDPDGPPLLVGTGSFGSRSLISHGGALATGAREVIRKGTELAARELEVAESDLAFAHGRYRVPGTDVSIGLAELARRLAGGGEHPLDTTLKVNTAGSFPSGAHVCEVEIDPATGVLELIRYVAVDDAGTIYNHTIVEGQLVGGLVQGIGQAMGEHCVYEPDTGQLVTGTFMDYFMPRADVLPEIALYDRPVPSPANPLGAKGAGEAGTTGAIPTIANAVIDALKPFGIAHLDMPFTPYRIWQAIRNATKGA